MLKLNSFRFWVSNRSAPISSNTGVSLFHWFLCRSLPTLFNSNSDWMGSDHLRIHTVNVALLWYYGVALRFCCLLHHYSVSYYNADIRFSTLSNQTSRIELFFSSTAFRWIFSILTVWYGMLTKSTRLKPRKRKGDAHRQALVPLLILVDSAQSGHFPISVLYRPTFVLNLSEKET